MGDTALRVVVGDTLFEISTHSTAYGVPEGAVYCAAPVLAWVRGIRLGTSEFSIWPGTGEITIKQNNTLLNGGNLGVPGRVGTVPWHCIQLATLSSMLIMISTCQNSNIRHPSTRIDSTRPLGYFQGTVAYGTPPAANVSICQATIGLPD